MNRCLPTPLVAGFHCPPQAGHSRTSNPMAQQTGSTPTSRPHGAPQPTFTSEAYHMEVGRFVDYAWPHRGSRERAAKMTLHANRLHSAGRVVSVLTSYDRDTACGKRSVDTNCSQGWFMPLKPQEASCRGKKKRLAGCSHGRSRVLGGSSAAPYPDLISPKPRMLGLSAVHLGA